VLRHVWSGAGQHVIVGERGTILRSNGSAWTPQQSGTQRFLRAAWGADPQNVWAVGDSGTVLRFDGGQWRTVVVPTQSRLRAIWGTAANDVFAVGDTGTVLRFDGVTWRASGSTVDLSASKFLKPDSIILIKRRNADDKGLVLRPY
jgi:photosystem II stability/assembly factor-like uncharacterized protein